MQANQNKVDYLYRLAKPTKEISCGEEHAALITADKEVFTWGYGNDGQLGNASKTQAAAPIKVEGLSGVAKVKCGEGHTAVINEKGEIYIFGRGRDGQLGRADVMESMAVSRAVPMRVDYFIQNGLVVKDIALGTNHSVALTGNK